MTMSRRTLLKVSAKLSAAALVARGLSPGVLGAADAPRPKLKLAVLNDLHYMDAGCTPFFTKLVKELNDLAPDAVLIAGDLVEAGTANEFAGIKAILGKLKAPFYVVPGNHDHTGADGKANKKPSRQFYEAAFPKSLNYTFDLAGWQFVCLDSCDGTKWLDVAGPRATLDFLDDALPKLDKKRPMILMTHFPLGEGVHMRLTNADDLLARFKDHNLLAGFSGHFHSFTEKKSAAGTIFTTNKCCSFRRTNHDKTLDKGYFVVTCEDGALARKFVEFAKDAPPKPAATATRPM